MARRNADFTEVFADAIVEVAPLRDRLRTMVDVTCDYYLRQHEFMRLFQEAIGRAWFNIKASFNEENFRQYQQIMTLEAAVFRDAMGSREIPEGDPAMLAAVFAGAVQAYLARLILDEGGPGDEARSRQALIELLERAFQVSP
jgi:AcrR family transcriptional regulator